MSVNVTWRTLENGEFTKEGRVCHVRLLKNQERKGWDN